MKSLIEVLEAVRDAYINETSDGITYFGLCTVSSFYSGLNDIEKDAFDQHYNERVRYTQEFFFDSHGYSTTDSDWYAWEIQDKHARIDWLNEEIDRLNLIRILNSILIKVKHARRDTFYGMCLLVRNLYLLDKISKKDCDMFEVYYQTEIVKEVDIFYEAMHGTTYRSTNSYAWEIGNKKPRIEWLEKHIKLNSQ